MQNGITAGNGKFRNPYGKLSCMEIFIAGAVRLCALQKILQRQAFLFHHIHFSLCVELPYNVHSMTDWQTINVIALPSTPAPSWKPVPPQNVCAVKTARAVSSAS